MPRGGSRPNTGGVRKGAGRPPLDFDGAALVRRTITVSETHAAQLLVLGKGNVSAGVRFLLDRMNASAVVEHSPSAKRAAKRRAREVR